MALPFKNEVRWAGIVGTTPELRYLTGGDATCSLRIVTRRRYKAGGEWRQDDEWMTAVFYRAQAEAVVAAGLGKGSWLYVEGRFKTRTWTQDGYEKKATELIVESWHVMDVPRNATAGVDDKVQEKKEPPRRPAAKKAAPAVGQAARESIAGLA